MRQAPGRDRMPAHACPIPTWPERWRWWRVARVESALRPVGRSLTTAYTSLSTVAERRGSLPSSMRSGKAVAAPGDCTDAEALDVMRWRIEDELGRIDILCAFAGGGRPPQPVTAIAGATAVLVSGSTAVAVWESLCGSTPMITW
jgi:NAD(P)-dependent dehydrogenase (short-subunit alcohol dehydrogenase family)